MVLRVVSLGEGVSPRYYNLGGTPRSQIFMAYVCALGQHFGVVNMLILTRRVGETLMVGDEVTVTVLGVKGNQVRIGVNAPKEVAVHREENYLRIKKEQDEEPSH